MKSEDIVISIKNLIRDVQTELKPIEIEMNRLRDLGDTHWEDLETSYKLKLKELGKPVSKLLDDLYISSSNDHYYFFDLPFISYKKLYRSRLELFLKQNIDANEKDFIESELYYFYKPSKNRILLHNDVPFSYHQFLEADKKYDITLEKKNEFLYGAAKKIGYKVDVYVNPFYTDDFMERLGKKRFEFVKIRKTKKQQIPDTEEPKKVKKNKQLTGNQIVILLERLEVFSNPNFKFLNKTDQANVLSRLTGLHEKNLKSYIENLGKKPSQLGPNYQKDIDKIDDLLRCLE